MLQYIDIHILCICPGCQVSWPPPPWYGLGDGLPRRVEYVCICMHMRTYAFICMNMCTSMCTSEYACMACACRHMHCMHLRMHAFMASMHTCMPHVHLHDTSHRGWVCALPSVGSYTVDPIGAPTVRTTSNWGAVTKWTITIGWVGRGATGTKDIYICIYII